MSNDSSPSLYGKSEPERAAVEAAGPVLGPETEPARVCEWPLSVFVMLVPPAAIRCGGGKSEGDWDRGRWESGGNGASW